VLEVSSLGLTVHDVPAPTPINVIEQDSMITDYDLATGAATT